MTLGRDAPLDLGGSLGPLVRGHGDRTIRLARDRAWWATRTQAGPATIGLTVLGRGRLRADGWGPGAEAALTRVPRLFADSTDVLADSEDPRIVALSRRRPGVRILRTGAVLESLVAAILEQKVTGTEAPRAWIAPPPRPGDPGREALLGVPSARRRAPASRSHPGDLA